MRLSIFSFLFLLLAQSASAANVYKDLRCRIFRVFPKASHVDFRIETKDPFADFVELGMATVQFSNMTFKVSAEVVKTQENLVREVRLIVDEMGKNNIVVWRGAIRHRASVFTDRAHTTLERYSDPNYGFPSEEFDCVPTYGAP